jgi:hypothetical protein
MDTLIETLRHRQLAETWSDREMAQRLGIGHVTWWRAYTGKYQLSARSLLRIMAGFPEYHGLAAAALSAVVSDSPDTHVSQKQMITSEPDTAMNPGPANDDDSESEGRNAA